MVWHCNKAYVYLSVSSYRAASVQHQCYPLEDGSRLLIFTKQVIVIMWVEHVCPSNWTMHTVSRSQRLRKVSRFSRYLLSAFLWSTTAETSSIESRTGSKLPLHNTAGPVVRNVCKITLEKILADKKFANNVCWQNSRKFSPGKNTGYRW